MPTIETNVTQPVSVQFVPTISVQFIPNTEILYDYHLKVLAGQRSDSDVLERKIQITLSIITLLGGATIFSVPTRMSAAEAVLHIVTIAVVAVAVYFCIDALMLRSYVETTNLIALNEETAEYDRAKTIAQLISNMASSSDKNYRVHEKRAAKLKCAVNNLLPILCLLILIIVCCRVINSVGATNNVYKPRDLPIREFLQW